ncbi:MAG: hypothetical protein C0600_12285 [Ignavibacteria bacterium]|nr:MAG: hypothetical protein C0600_12285 [Ignavibacteria bacterium]
MFKNLVDFSGYETLAVAAMVFFFIIFLAILLRVFFLNRQFTTAMEHLPLQSDDGTLTADKEQE